MSRINKLFEGLDRKSKTGMVSITCGIIDFIVKRKGETTFKEIEEHTQLVKVSKSLVVDVLKFLASHSLIRVSGSTVSGDIDKLTEMMEQERIHLPENHNKLWKFSEDEKLAELKIQKLPNSVIALDLKRTENAVKERAQAYRIGKEILHNIEKSEIIRTWLEIPVSPKPAEKDR